MSFLDFINKIVNKGIKIIDGVYLKQGESVHIYGEPFVGKTTMCFYIIKQNPEKSVVYVNSENLSPKYTRKLKTLSNNVYILNCFNIDWLLSILEQLHFDYLIVDSLTAMNYIANKKKLAELFDIVIDKKMNMVLVSQVRENKGRKYYEHRKLLNFMSYRIDIRKEGTEMILNDEHAIDFDEIW
jgi:predicted ATP-dependent serine protease